MVGDPGLLVPFLWPKCGRACSPSCDVCLLLHHNDKGNAGVMKEQMQIGACFLGRGLHSSTFRLKLSRF